jgi:asparagine synthase (glutamine-hydrolysing)
VPAVLRNRSKIIRAIHRRRNLFVHVFAISANIDELTPEQLSRAVGALGEEFHLDDKTAWCARSRAGAITAAGVHHGDEAGPRRYVERTDSAITLFDGLPVDPEREHRAHDASVLARGWSRWADRLEGQFAAARIDLLGEQAEIRLDSFGLIPVFASRRGQGVLVSTSLRIIQSLLRLHEPDPIGVSALMGTGHLLDRTLVSGILALRGGAVHRLGGGVIETRAIFGPESLAPRLRRPFGAADLAEQMVRVTSAAMEDVEPVRCPITAGRDSRVLVALSRHAGKPVDYYTAGRRGDADVDIAAALGAQFGLPHRIVEPGGSDAPIDGVRAATHFIEQNEGFATLIQLVDYVDLDGAPSHIGLKLIGDGGELGRVRGPAVAIENLPLAGHFASLQRRALGHAFKRSGYDFMTPQGVGLVDSHISELFATRRAEGWPVNELTEAFLGFSGPPLGVGDARRTSATDDVFSPFRTRAFAEYCFALSPAERYVEIPHHRLLMELSPELRRFRYEWPFPIPRARLAALRAAADMSLLVRRRLGLASSATTAGGGEWFMPAWVEENLGALEMLLDSVSSRLWEFLSRERIAALLRASPAERASNLAGLLRAATVMWFFGGPRPRDLSCAPLVRAWQAR